MSIELKYEKIWRRVLEPDEEIKYEFSTSEKYCKFWSKILCLIGLLGVAIILFLKIEEIFIFKELVEFLKELGFFYKKEIIVIKVGLILFLILVLGTLFGTISGKRGAWALTNKRILMYFKSGRYGTNLLSFPYNEIRETFIEEHCLGKFFNTGNLVIRTTKPFIFEEEVIEQVGRQTISRIEERKEFYFKLHVVEDPWEAKKKLDEIRETKKEER